MPAGLIGLGNMGRGMALSLLRNGHAVLGFDLSADTRASRAAEAIAIAETLPALIRACDIIILSLPHAAAVRAVIEGSEGILAHAAPGTLIIDTTTSEPGVTRDLAGKLRAAGFAMIDAPVSGGPKGALSGTMTMVIGGEAADLARAMPLLEAMSAKRVHVGPSGAGHVTKLVNNLLCGANLVLLGEAMGLIEEAGLDVQTVFSGINAGSGRSGVSEVNLPNWIANGAFNSGFTMGLMRKDIRLAAQLMDELEIAPPLAKAVAGIWAASVASLPDGEDFNRIVELRGEGQGA
ncbi:MAG: NAD(P)-dependent oxidoreductase [Beijerinckiaceae bacterium]|nr:NAD(P)-dependent oxidoreductase [Beijerinckiaceae bacterium]